MITVQQKTELIKALEEYLKFHNLSQNDFCVLAEINAAYLIEMRKGSTHIKVGTKVVEISDKYYLRLAEFIDFKITEAEKAVTTKATPQFSFIVSRLAKSLANAESTMIIGDTGVGKTFSLDAFKKKNPGTVFSIKIGSNDKMRDILDKMAAALKLKYWKGSTSFKIGLVCKHLKALKEAGSKVMFVFDESEYLKQIAMCAIKEIYDYLLGICPVVIIATPELIKNIEKLIARGKTGIAQLWRRYKHKVCYVPKIEKGFELFLDGVDAQLSQWLLINCNNYGELTDILTPCTREAQRLSKPLDLNFVTTVLGL